MAAPKDSKNYPNPFYVILVVAGTAFVFTVLGFLIAPMVLEKAQNLPAGAKAPGSGSLALANWFEHHSISAITIEISIMIVSSLAAMATDRWFARQPES